MGSRRGRRGHAEAGSPPRSPTLPWLPSRRQPAASSWLLPTPEASSHRRAPARFGNGFGNNPFSGNGTGGNGTGTGNSPGANISQGTLTKVENAVKPGLVVITSNLKYDGSGAAAAATGMIISKSGLVLTNNHVINGTTGLRATVVATGRQYQPSGSATTRARTSR